jgi:sulfhydrogenase subunit beta (sulfur reductase)
MQTLRMDTSLLGSFLEALKAFGTLIAPVERSPGVFTLAPIDDVSAARPDALRTVLPFKKLLLKPQFTMLERRPGTESIDSADNDWPPMVYFGAHACVVHALKILDLLYLNDYVDPYYKRTGIGSPWSPTAACRTTSASALRRAPPTSTTASTSP